MRLDDNIRKLSQEQIKDLKKIQEKLQELAELFKSYLERMEPPESVEASSFVQTILMDYYEKMLIRLIYGMGLSKNLVAFFEECPTKMLRLVFHPKEDRRAHSKLIN